MVLRRRIALVALLALISLPVGGTVCALLCEATPAEAMAHHQECEEAPPAASGPQLSGAPAPDCGSHGATLRQVATAAAGRADLRATSAPALAAAPGALAPPRRVHGPFDAVSPPGIAPPTIRPIVLRI